tara:strand:+ start:232 stop:540 length:309 start_codon:yes stop_codon:yes gene_type:complete
VIKMTIWDKIRNAFLLLDDEVEPIPTPEETFIAGIESKGFYYNTELSDITGDRWTRKWITEHGHDSILEVYCKETDTKWIQQMVSTDGEVFYEERVIMDKTG